MSALQNARAFFDACESGGGWAGCRQYVAEDATFSAQCEPLAEMTGVEEYTEWMAGFIAGVAPGASYDVHVSAFDESTNTAVFFATFHGKHTADGGPVPPTNKETHSHYVYSLSMDNDGKLCKMVKIWNPTWALTELGWT